MPESKKPKHNWLAIRTAYVVKRWTPDRISKEFGVHPTTVKTRAAKEGWTAERDRNATQGDQIATEESRKVVEAAAKERAQSDSAIAETLRGLIKDSIDDLGKIEDLGSKIVARNQIMLMGQRFLTVNRIVRGIVPGQPSDTGELDAPQGPTAAGAGSELDGESAPAPMRRFVVKIHQPALSVVPDQQATG